MINKRRFTWIIIAKHLLQVLIAMLYVSPLSALAFESQAERSERIFASFQELGIQVVHEESCPSGIKGWHEPIPPSDGGRIVLCINEHETGGSVTLTLFHEMGHAIQHCLGGAMHNDIVDITEIVYVHWDEYLTYFKENSSPHVRNIMKRVNAGEELALYELLLYDERLDVSELYPSDVQELEIEARAMLFLSFEEILELAKKACGRRAR